MDEVDNETIGKIIAENTALLRSLIKVLADAPKEKLDPVLIKEFANFGDDADPVLFCRNMFDKLAILKPEDLFVAKSIKAAMVFFPETPEEEALRRANLMESLKTHPLFKDILATPTELA